MSLCEKERESQISSFDKIDFFIISKLYKYNKNIKICFLKGFQNLPKKTDDESIKKTKENLSYNQVLELYEQFNSLFTKEKGEKIYKELLIDDFTQSFQEKNIKFYEVFKSNIDFFWTVCLCYIYKIFEDDKNEINSLDKLKKKSDKCYEKLQTIDEEFSILKDRGIKLLAILEILQNYYTNEIKFTEQKNKSSQLLLPEGDKTQIPNESDKEESKKNDLEEYKDEIDKLKQKRIEINEILKSIHNEKYLDEKFHYLRENKCPKKPILLQYLKDLERIEKNITLLNKINDKTDMDKELNSLKDINNDNKKNLFSLKKENQTLKCENDNLIKENSKIKEENKKYEININLLNKKLEESKISIKNKTKENINMKDENIELNKKIQFNDNNSKNITDYDYKIKSISEEKEKSEKKLKEINKNLIGQISEKKEELLQINEKLKEEKDMNKIKDANISHMIFIKKSSEELINAKTKEINEKITEIKQQKSKYSQLNTKINQMQENDTNQIAEIKQLLSKNKEFNQKINELKQKVEDMTQTIRLNEKVTEENKAIIQKQQNEIYSIEENLKKSWETIKILSNERNQETKKFEIEKNKFLEKSKKLVNKNKELSNVIESNDENIKKLEKQREELKSKMEELNEGQSKLQSKYENLKKSYENLLQEFLDFKSHFNLNPHQKNQSKKSTKTDYLPYDMIINIDSLKTEKIGWDITINQTTLDKLNFSKKFSIIGLVGRENIGKTFILNKICGFDLPSGTNINTKGLSLKYSNKNNLICLDSAGIQTPVYYFDEKLLKRFSMTKEKLKENSEMKRQMINDRTITDIFIQDFILEVCEVIVIVVGQLSQNDQKFIERIAMKYQSKKRIIVVHNFSNLYAIDDIQKKIEKDIIDAFDVIPRIIPDSDEVYEYIEKSQKKEQENISHVVLGVDWCDSGRKYNSQTFNYIRNILETRIEKRKFNIVDELNHFLSDNYRLYLNFKKRPVKGVTLKQNNQNNLTIQTDEEFEISNPIFNALGNLLTNPPFEVLEEKNKYIVLIEISDLKLESLKFELDSKKSEFNILIISGVKNVSKAADGKKFLNIMGTRNYGEFSYMIPLGERNLKVTVDKKNYKYQEGVLMVEINLVKEEIINL